jgi:hypothetical protein
MPRSFCTELLAAGAAIPEDDLAPLHTNPQSAFDAVVCGLAALMVEESKQSVAVCDTNERATRAHR